MSKADDKTEILLVVDIITTVRYNHLLCSYVFHPFSINLFDNKMTDRNDDIERAIEDAGKFLLGVR